MEQSNNNNFHKKFFFFILAALIFSWGNRKIKRHFEKKNKYKFI